VSVRELIVLGTASQAPTRHRNHNGYLLPPSVVIPS